MRLSDSYRECIRTNLVEPLLEFFSLAEILLWTPMGAAERHEIGRRLAPTSQQQISPEAARRVTSCCETFRRRQDPSSSTNSSHPGSRTYKSDDHAQIARTFNMIGATGHDLPYTRWGLIEPLEIYLTIRSQAITTQNWKNSVDQFEECVLEWVRRIPVPGIAAQDALALLTRLPGEGDKIAHQAGP